jgi:hypothetical protein
MSKICDMGDILTCDRQEQRAERLKVVAGIRSFERLRSVIGC